MPVQVTMCRLCARSRPEFLQALLELLAAHPNELVVEELECMAACDDVPALMIETDYYPQVRACELPTLLRQHLGAVTPTADA